MDTAELRRQISRRRTFAIISHPDAGKTTLTEKLLLYGGAIRQAGVVRGQGARRAATSDWLELEKQRGISVSSSVMTFDHRGMRVNILDTPGHHDFSEDTYRTLAAADSAVMLIDAGKGVETQTRKLFKVCRQRGIPIFTFINKMDRLGRDPLELMSEIEEVLGIHATPVNWPVGQGSDFRGVYDRIHERLLLFAGGRHGSVMVDERTISGKITSPEVKAALGPLYGEVGEALDLLDGAGETLDRERVRTGQLTPMYFGSALTNFGILPFLDSFLEMAPGPQSYRADIGMIEPSRPQFSGFVFKIQANMDPAHRDRIAMVRVCSGRFERGATTIHSASRKNIRMAYSTQLLAQDRQEVDEAWPGDVVGLFDPGLFGIGDTLSDEGFKFEGIPRFAPEHFVRVRVDGGTRRKALQKGLEQLTGEGLVQLFTEGDAGLTAPILGAVGPLQFDVLKFRMKSEYNVDIDLTKLSFVLARWTIGKIDESMFSHSMTTKAVRDRAGNTVLLFETPWAVNWALEQYKGLELAESAPALL